MLVNRGTTARVAISLKNSSGAAVTGMGPANFSGSAVSVVDSASVVTSVPLTGLNFFEVSATAAPGVYHLLLPLSVTDVADAIQVVALPAATAFTPQATTHQIADLNLDFQHARKVLRNRAEISFDDSTLSIKDDDGTTELLAYGLTNLSGNPESTHPSGRVPS